MLTSGKGTVLAFLAMLAPEWALHVAPDGCAARFPYVARRGQCMVRPGRESSALAEPESVVLGMDDGVALRIEHPPRPASNRGLTAPPPCAGVAGQLVQFVPGCEQGAVLAGMALCRGGDGDPGRQAAPGGDVRSCSNAAHALTTSWGAMTPRGAERLGEPGPPGPWQWVGAAAPPVAQRVSWPQPRPWRRSHVALALPQIVRKNGQNKRSRGSRCSLLSATSRGRLSPPDRLRCLGRPRPSLHHRRPSGWRFPPPTSSCTVSGTAQHAIPPVLPRQCRRV